MNDELQQRQEDWNRRYDEMYKLLGQCVDVMRVTQRLFSLTDGHLLMTKCKEIEDWMEQNG